MKKEKKYFGLIKFDVPENEWEAKYLNTKEKLDVLASLVILTLVFGAIYIFMINTSGPLCNIEIEGDVSGKFDLSDLTEGKIKNASNISSVGGKVKASLPCDWIVDRLKDSV